MSNEDLTAAPASFGIPSVSVDGGDVQELDALFQRLVAEVRAERQPRFVEVRFDRWPGNYDLWPAMASGETDLECAFDGSPPSEIAEWSAKADPILRELAAIVADGAASAAEIRDLDDAVIARIDVAAAAALDSPFPDPATARSHVVAEPVR